MGTQIKAGSKGQYISPSSLNREKGVPFVVVEDTCLEANTIPCNIQGMSHSSNIRLTDVKFDEDAVFEDY